MRVEQQECAVQISRYFATFEQLHFVYCVNDEDICRFMRNCSLNNTTILLLSLCAATIRHQWEMVRSFCVSFHLPLPATLLNTVTEY